MKTWMTVVEGAEYAGVRQRPDETTGGFGADTLRVPRFAPENRFSVDFAFAQVFRNDHFVLPNPIGGGTLRAGTMAQHLDLYKDNVVLFGDLTGGVDLGFGTSDRPDVPFTYANFMCAEGNWWFADEDPPDGDLSFQMRVDRLRLDADQPDFFTDGQWQPGRDPNDIRESLISTNRTTSIRRSSCSGGMPGKITVRAQEHRCCPDGAKEDRPAS